MLHPRGFLAALTAALVLSGCTTAGTPVATGSPSDVPSTPAPSAGSSSVQGGQVLSSTNLGISLTVPTELTLLAKARVNDPAMDSYWKQMAERTGVSAETLKASVAGTEGYATDPEGSALVLYDTKQPAVPRRELLETGLGGQLKVKDLHIEATQTAVGKGWKVTGTLTVGKVELYQYYLYAKGPGTAFSITVTSASSATAARLYDAVIPTIVTIG